MTETPIELAERLRALGFAVSAADAAQMAPSVAALQASARAVAAGLTRYDEPAVTFGLRAPA